MKCRNLLTLYYEPLWNTVTYSTLDMKSWSYAKSIRLWHNQVFKQISARIVSGLSDDRQSETCTPAKENSLSAGSEALGIWSKS